MVSLTFEFKFDVVRGGIIFIDKYLKEVMHVTAWKMFECALLIQLNFESGSKVYNRTIWRWIKNEIKSCEHNFRRKLADQNCNSIDMQSRARLPSNTLLDQKSYRGISANHVLQSQKLSFLVKAIYISLLITQVNVKKSDYL